GSILLPSRCPAIFLSKVKLICLTYRNSDFRKSCQAQESKRIKNISLHNSVNQNYNSARLVPTRGAYHDRHDTWGAGCDGRFGVRRELSRRTKTPRRTAKSCGPGAATLALSLWSHPQVTVANT